MSKRYTVICHRCGKSTFVDLSKTISDQRCRACRGFLQGVDVSIGGATEVQKKVVWREPGAAGREPEWRDQEVPVIPLRQRWPAYYRWIIWTGLTLFLCGVAYATWRKFRNSRSIHREAIGQIEAPPTDIRLTEEWRLKATSLAQKALAAQNLDDLLPLLYHPEVDVSIIRRYYEMQEQLPLGKDLQEEYYVPPGNYSENVVAFTFADFKNRQRAFVVVEKPEGMRIDWPSLVGLGEMSVQDYVRTQPEKAVVMRARARLGNYYNHHFADSSRWLSVRLADVTDENVVYGYVDRSLPMSGIMERTLPNPEARDTRPDEPVIVVLKHPSGNVTSDQTQIMALVATTWYHQEGIKPLIDYARRMDEAGWQGPAPAATGTSPEEKNEDKPKGTP